MTVRYKPTYSHGIMEPRRRMIAADLGLDLLISPYDRDLLAAGIQAPRLTSAQKHANTMRTVGTLHRPKGGQGAATRRFNKTVLGKQVKQEVAEILQRYRWLGSVRGQGGR